MVSGPRRAKKRTMHKCLQIPELVIRIAEDLHPRYKDPPGPWCAPGKAKMGSEGSAAVLALARTCRTILEPALDVLWYTQQDILPSLKLLSTPSITVDVGRGFDSADFPLRSTRSAADVRNWCVEHGQDPLSGGWLRLDYYTARVRNIAIGGDIHVRLVAGHDSIIATLEILATLKGNPLFPDLRYLDMQDVHDHSKPPSIFQSLCYANLWSLSVAFNLDSPEFCAAFLAVLRASPELRSLHLTLSAHMAQFDDSFEYLSALSSVLRRYSSLVECTLDVNYCILPYNQLLPLIASWPKLQRLSFCNDSILSPRDGTTHMDPEDERHRHAFPDIKDVVVNLGMTKTSTILSTTSFPSVQQCELTLVLPDSIPTLPDLRPILLSLSPATLESLSLFFPGPKGDLLPASSRAWEPLSWFTNLRELTIATHDTSSLNDAAWDAYARSWPRLHILEVEPTPSKNAPAAATYKALASIARWCEEIESIAMPITDAPRPEPQERAALPVASGLKVLNLWHSPIQDLEVVAEWVVVMFPGVWRTPTPMGLSKKDLYDTKWQRLFELVEQCRKGTGPTKQTVQ